MMYNLVLGIVLPWTVALFLVRKSERYVVVVMSPFATTLGYTLNTLWTY
ncbi:hypothetical protein [Alicyclobacillus sp. SO9]|nr:hypothetical protein [Alicyclobacillus sp. SO9]QQE77076.1 hypothetical protein GI364_13930 [Alicyclobacillus sp. SO9]